MFGLMKKLETIQKECVDKSGQQAVGADDEKLDEFTRLKRKIGNQVKNIRTLIQDRDEMEKTAPGTVAAVELSANLRYALKEMRVDATQLDKLQKDEKAAYIKKNKEDTVKEAQIENREEVVELVFEHYKECLQLDRKRHGESAFSRPSDPNKPVVAALPDIDQAGFQLLKRNDEVINKLLDGISDGVQVLHEQANQMQQEAINQGIQLDELDANVNDVNEKLENINTRLRKALESVRKGDRFIVDIILLCVLIGLIGYIYSVVK